MGLTIRDLLVREHGVTFTPRINQVLDTVLTGAFATVLRQNPSRVGFLFVNSGAFVVNVVPAPRNSATGVIRIEPNGGALITHWKEDGEVVSAEWLATAIGGTSTVLILETVIERLPQAAREA